MNNFSQITASIRNVILKFSILSCLFIISGCASQTSWTPTVDPYGDPNAFRLNQDYNECKQLAIQASGGTVRQTATGVAVGGLIGAATGAALGAISGNPGSGAAYGATIGGIGGGVRQGYQAEGGYKKAYNNCMRHRGHYIVN